MKILYSPFEALEYIWPKLRSLLIAPEQPSHTPYFWHISVMLRIFCGMKRAADRGTKMNAEKGQ